MLVEAISLSAAQSAAELPRWRAVLSQAGRNAAQDRWRSEIQRALVRLRGDLPPRDEQVDVGLLRRRLDDIARGVAPGGAEVSCDG